MEKTVKLLATLRDLTGKKTLTVPFEDGQTVRKFIDDLTDWNRRYTTKLSTPTAS